MPYLFTRKLLAERACETCSGMGYLLDPGLQKDICEVLHGHNHINESDHLKPQSYSRARTKSYYLLPWL